VAVTHELIAAPLTSAQGAWLRYVERVERGEIIDPSGQYVAKGTMASVDASGHRIVRPKYDVATTAFNKHYRLGRNGKVIGVPATGNDGTTSLIDYPCDCGELPPAPTTTFVSSEGRAPYSGADNADGYIYDLKIGHGSAQGDHDGIPSSYTVLYSDLNKGAGGPFIYIGFTRVPSDASENPEAIHHRPYAVGPVTEIGIVKKYSYFDDYPAFGPPLYPVWVDTGTRDAFAEYDLNEGVGGTYIRAYNSKQFGAISNGQAIEVGVLSGNSSSIVPPSGWVKASTDLNENAGGDFIYFCIKAR
jgi:hypothetical protein